MDESLDLVIVGDYRAREQVHDIGQALNLLFGRHVVAFFLLDAGIVPFL
jgi:hypothetical protein